MNRTIFFIALLWITTTVSEAQNDFSVQLKGDPASMKVEVSNLFSKLTFEGHNSNQIEVEVEGYRGMPEKARGLKPLSSYGEDNTNTGLYVEEKGNVVLISGASRATRDAEYVIKIPQNLKLMIESEDWNADDIQITGMKNEVEVKANSSALKLEDVTGPLVLNSMNGEIEVSFSQLSQTTPSSISATNGDIDIALPVDSKADFRLSCLNGEIYTDLEVSFSDEERSSMQRIGGGIKTDASIGGGGVEFSIRAINGNIYLRKR